MKKLLGIVVLVLFASNSVSAKIIDLSCKGFKSYDREARKLDNDFEDYMHLRVDTSKKIMIEFDDGNYANMEWKLTEINDRYFYSNEGIDNGFNNDYDEANLNRFTGEYFSTTGEVFPRYFYHCTTTKQLF